MGCSWSLYIAQSANRTRLNPQPSVRHSVEMTDRGPPLVVNKQGQNAQINHYLYVDNIGINSDQFSQVHVALDESKQDFVRDRLLLHEISKRILVEPLVLSSTSNSCGLSLPWNGSVAFAKGSDAF